MKDTRIFSDDQLKSIIMALARTGRPFTESDAERAVRWCELTLIGTHFLEGVLLGKCGMYMPEVGEPEFKPIDPLEDPP